MSLVVSDAVGRILSTALDGVTQNQNAIADNIANVDTPNYRATHVDFQSALSAAISDGSAASGNLDVTPQVVPTDTPVGADGNNVDLRTETMAAAQSQFQYQTLTRAISDRFALVHDAVSGA